MQQHILAERAYRYPEALDMPAPEGCTFNNQKGYWIDDVSGQAMMKCDSRQPQTKKADVETGEDQKGE